MAKTANEIQQYMLSLGSSQGVDNAAVYNLQSATVHTYKTFEVTEYWRANRDKFDLTIIGDCSAEREYDANGDDLFSPLPARASLRDLLFSLERTSLSYCQNLTLFLKSVNEDDVEDLANLLRDIWPLQHYHLKELNLHFTFVNDRVITKLNTNLKTLTDQKRVPCFQLEEKSGGGGLQFMLKSLDRSFWFDSTLCPIGRQEGIANKQRAYLRQLRREEKKEEDEATAARGGASWEDENQPLVIPSTMPEPKPPIVNPIRVTIGLMLVAGTLIPLLNKFVFEQDNSFHHHDQEILLIASLALFTAAFLVFKARIYEERTQRHVWRGTGEKISPSRAKTAFLNGVGFYSLCFATLGSLGLMAATGWGLYVADFPAESSVTKGVLTGLYSVLAVSATAVGYVAAKSAKTAR